MDKGIAGVTALGFGLSEYIKMFGLTEHELNMRILDCRAGASSFTSDMYQKKKHVTACDPLYQLPVDELKKLVNHASEELKTTFKEGTEKFSILPEKAQEYLNLIESGTKNFFSDFSIGLSEGRYCYDSLPTLSFRDGQFGLALVCHYLFTFSEQLSLSYHVASIEELIRVANEVRIFPLVTTKGQLSPYVGEVVAKLQSLSYGVEIRGVEYELQKQGNAMLRIWAPECQVATYSPTQ
ncbi:MAG: hypothetical protein AB7D28_09925 [Candidatus Berkiella sp.]